MFDRQAAARQQGSSDQAVALGGFGGGREGVQLAEYQTQSDRNRALLQAGMLQQGYTQACTVQRKSKSRPRKLVTPQQYNKKSVKIDQGLDLLKFWQGNRGKT